MTTATTTMKTVRELALEIPHATRVFERLGIDYCCGGGKSLEAACTTAKVSIEEVQRALEKASQTPEPDRRNWQTEPLADLIAHINSRHHTYLREALPRIQALLAKVCAKHGQTHPELNRMHSIFEALSEELTVHLMKEEKILFPYVERMEEAIIQKEPIVPGCFGSVKNPISMMETEHDNAGEALKSFRSVSRNYELPADACMSYRTLFSELQDLEADLHQHIHLENNLLFPRAAELESRGLR